MANKISKLLHDRRVLLLFVVTFLSLSLVMLNGGPKFGIDFSGGIRIPIVLEQSVNPVVMEEMVQTIKTRASSFGLTEVKVRPIGSSEIYVEVPRSSPQLVEQIESLLAHQGVYYGIVDGKIAISGDDIYTGTISRLPPRALRGGDWGVSFSVTPEGQARFAQVVKGKANYPLYMFLDRPVNAIVVISKEDLLAKAGNASSQISIITQDDALRMAADALNLEEKSIPVYLESELLSQGNLSIKPENNQTIAIISSQAKKELKQKLVDAGFKLKEVPPEDMQPKYEHRRNSALNGWVSEWKAVGLRSAPGLSPSVTEGVPSFSYQITGAADGSGNEKLLNAEKNARELQSILKGGALPVQINIGSTVDIPAPLGEQFLRMSVIGGLFALLAISATVALRYRKPKIIVPIVLISISEMIILVSIIGSFSIDLAAMAGILAAIGVSVDAQIVVTDELLKEGTTDMAAKLDAAFDIITTNVVVAVFALLPLLLFSGLVEIIGFATSTMLGYLLGLFVTRPAYGAIAEILMEK